MIYETLTAVFFAISLYLWLKVSKNADKKYTETELSNQVQQIHTEQKIVVETKIQETKAQLLEQFQDKNDVVIEKLKYEAQAKIRIEELDLRKQIQITQDKLLQKESQIDSKLEYLDSEKIAFKKSQDAFITKQSELNNREQTLAEKERTLGEQIDSKLAKVAGLSTEQAKTLIIERTKEKLGENLIGMQNKMVSLATDEANEKARQIVSLAIQRCSSDVANEMTVTTVKLTSEEDKGKLIGKQGRNIQWLEKTLGVELIIDDTPDVVTISGFNSIRRHIAKKTIEKLLTDGRVHPAAIEEMCEKAKGELSAEVVAAGEFVCTELGIFDFPPKLVRILGRLKFRTSYGQNMLRHSLEMAKLTGLMVDELNSAFPSRNPIDKMTAIKGALLHDIGKAVDEETSPKGNHIELGERICDMFELGWKVKKCISSHHMTGGDYQSYHDEENGFCIEACVVDACDNLSGSRPGARKETVEAYLQRLEAIERVVNNIQGVQKSYIMRGGKTLWVFFNPDTNSTAKMQAATMQIVDTINATVKLPYKIEVVGMLENRLVLNAG